MYSEDYEKVFVTQHHSLLLIAAYKTFSFVKQAESFRNPNNQLRHKCINPTAQIMIPTF